MKKNTNSKKSQEYILDLSDFNVDATDSGETYATFSKFFDNQMKGFALQSEILSNINDQVRAGQAKYFLCESFCTPLAWFPMIRCKHINLEEYDEYGDYNGFEEDEENQDIVDVYSCVKEIELYPGRFGGITVKIKLLLTYLSPERIDTKYYPPMHPQITAYGEMPDAVD